jgi:CubicO group peptidase (beta-lactamase class C family)
MIPKCILLFYLWTLSGLVLAQFEPDKLDEFILSHTATQQFSGSVLVARNENILFHKAYGLANRNFNIPNNINTKFRIGSISKLFTSVAIYQLEKSGKLSIDDKVVTYLPDWKRDDLFDDITIKHLLTHSSGLANYMDNQRWKNGVNEGKFVSVDDYKPIVFSEKLQFTPGHSQSYSNSGYIVLGAIVEKLSGKSYDSYITMHILNPLFMSNTHLYRLDRITSNIATGYTRKKSNSSGIFWENNLFSTPLIGSPAGDCFSSTEDLFKFIKYLKSSRLLTDEIYAPKNKPEVKTIIIHGQPFEGHFSNYGFTGLWNNYGFAVWEDSQMIGHTGGSTGSTNILMTEVALDSLSIIVLSNQTDSVKMEIVHYIQDMFNKDKTSIDL